MLSGGQTLETSVTGGGYQIIDGGMASGTSVSVGGSQIIQDGGLASGTTLSGGPTGYAYQIVNSSGRIVGTTLSGQFTILAVSAGAAASGITDIGSFVTVSAGGMVSGLTSYAGGIVQD